MTFPSPDSRTHEATATVARSADRRPGAGTAPVRRPGTWRNLVLSMALVFVVVAVSLALVPRHARIERPEVDVSAKARQVNAQTGLPIALLAPSPQWRSTGTSWALSPEGLPTWQAGYHKRPDDEVYVSLTQARLGADAAVNQAWLTRQVFEGSAVGWQQADAGPWQRFVANTDPLRRSLVRRAARPGDLTTVLSGNLSFEELGALASGLRPLAAATSAKPTASSATG